MPSKGDLPHRRLKEMAIQKAVTVFDIDKIDQIHIEPIKRTYKNLFSIKTNLFGLGVEKVFYPDIVFRYPLDEPVKPPTNHDISFDLLKDEKITHKIVVIECEVRANSQLLRGGLRRIGYELLKEQYGDLLHLILAKYKGVKMTNTDIFDEIWEFPKDSEEESDEYIEEDEE